MCEGFKFLRQKFRRKKMAKPFNHNDLCINSLTTKNNNTFSSWSTHIIHQCAIHFMCIALQLISLKCLIISISFVWNKVLILINNKMRCAHPFDDDDGMHLWVDSWKSNERLRTVYINKWIARWNVCLNFK